MNSKDVNQWVPLPRYIFRKNNVLRLVSRLKGVKSFIDVGCGAGDLACTLAELGYKGFGYDFSKEAITVANQLKKKRGITDKKLLLNYSTKSPEKFGKKADMVFCLEVLEHIKEDKKVFNSLVTVAKKYLIISVPAKRQLFDSSDKLAGHYRRYDRRDLLKLVNNKDVKVMQIISYGYPFTNIIRKVREFLSKRHKDNRKKLEEKSKRSGIHIFKVGRTVKMLPLEKITKPFYWLSLPFNSLDLSEGYLVLLQKTQVKK